MRCLQRDSVSMPEETDTRKTQGNAQHNSQQCNDIPSNIGPRKLEARTQLGINRGARLPQSMVKRPYRGRVRQRTQTTIRPTTLPSNSPAYNKLITDKMNSAQCIHFQNIGGYPMRDASQEKDIFSI